MWLISRKSELCHCKCHPISLLWNKQTWHFAGPSSKGLMVIAVNMVKVWKIWSVTFWSHLREVHICRFWQVSALPLRYIPLHFLSPDCWNPAPDKTIPFDSLDWKCNLIWVRPGDRRIVTHKDFHLNAVQLQSNLYNLEVWNWVGCRQ